MRVVNGVVQHYAWGDRDAIPGLLGVPGDGRPWAEAWFGTHSGGPSTLDDGTPLSAVAGELPYLVKLLAAAEPLSLQTHPDGDTARAGFAREEGAGIPIDDPMRIYKDTSAKPELVCALTAFEAVCGFRPQAATEALLDRLGATPLRDLIATSGLREAFAALYHDPILSSATVTAAAAVDTPEGRMVAALARRYPGDPSAAVALLLNHVVLRPGEALFLGAGNLHAYLRGVGVEVMGASDNVVRGGLTSKHVDVAELLRVVRPEPLEQPVVVAVEESLGCFRYPTAPSPFGLRRFEVGSTPVEVTASGPEILLCTTGDAGPLRAGMAGLLLDGERAMLRGPSTVFMVGAAGGYRQSR